MKILILGGYGAFGGRLVKLLADIPELEMFICGRNQLAAQAFCEAFKGVAIATPLRLDRKHIASALSEHKPDMVVDASGPFQNYGDDPYFIIKACIDAKTDYVDFADGADFVFGVSQFDGQAKTNGVFALSGVSSFPVLTAAVLRRIEKDMEIHEVTGGLAPSPYAGLGLNVMRAVLGYAGSPVKLTRNGVETEARGLTESKRYTIAPPGILPLRNLRFSLVDVPDLQVIPKEHKSLQDIWIGAGPVPEILHRMLNLLAKVRAAFKLPSYVPLAPLFYRVLNLVKFGEHRSGLFMHVKGKKNGKPVSTSWHLLAKGDDGPYIPSMAIEAIVRKMLKSERPANGARPATNALELEDYENLFESKTIYTGFRGSIDEKETLYKQVLGSAFENLPKPVQQLHSGTGKTSWSGTAKVTRGKGLLASFVASIIGFPKQTESTPVSVAFEQDEKGEKWTRDFGGKKFHSHQYRGTGRYEHLLIERFGPINVALGLVVEDGRLYLIPRHWDLFSIPLPKFLLPKGTSYETTKEDKFNFNIEIAAPIIGLIVAYKGELERDR